MVPFENSVELYNKLVSLGVDTEFIVYEGASHMLGEAFPEANAERAQAFYSFVEKYCG